MNNVQFATAIHILTLLASFKDSLSSTYIAGSINTNPAVVRKSLSILSQHGLVETKEGKGGGARLAKPADQIVLGDVYRAIIDTPLLGRFNDPNPACQIGRQINVHLNKLYGYADEALVRKLSTITLTDFSKQFN
jgi:Rrf2 family protein